MEIDIKTNFKNKIPFTDRQKILARIGKTLSDNIEKRTEFQNVDYKGKKFKKYSPGYAKYRAKNNLSSTPNLVKSGQMVGSLGIVNINNNNVEVGVKGGHNEDKAEWNEGNGRQFLGVSKDDEKMIDDIVDRYVTDELNNL